MDVQKRSYTHLSPDTPIFLRDLTNPMAQACPALEGYKKPNSPFFLVRVPVPSVRLQPEAALRRTFQILAWATRWRPFNDPHGPLPGLMAVFFNTQTLHRFGHRILDTATWRKYAASMTFISWLWHFSSLSFQYQSLLSVLLCMHALYNLSLYCNLVVVECLLNFFKTKSSFSVCTLNC